MKAEEIIDKYYPAGTPLRDIFYSHSRAVADFALELNRNFRVPLPETEVETAAMLHDIGIFLTHAPSIRCLGDEPYLKHGWLGAELLRKEGFEEKYARVCERHTGSGLTIENIAAACVDLPLDRSYLPETKLEKLICYADKFFSKSGSMQKKSLEAVERSMKAHGDDSFGRFMELKDRIESF